MTGYDQPFRAVNATFGTPNHEGAASNRVMTWPERGATDNDVEVRPRHQTARVVDGYTLPAGTALVCGQLRGEPGCEVLTDGRDHLAREAGISAGSAAASAPPRTG